MVPGPCRSWEQSLLFPSQLVVSDLPPQEAQWGLDQGGGAQPSPPGPFALLAPVTPGGDDKSGENLLCSPQSSLPLHHHSLCIGSVFLLCGCLPCVLLKKKKKIFEVG